VTGLDFPRIEWHILVASEAGGSSLRQYAAVYVRLMDGSAGYLDQLEWAIASFERWAGRQMPITELTENLINDYLAGTKEKLSPQTRLSRRNMLLRIWRHAATNPALSIRPQMPNRDLIGKVRRRQKSPEAWSIEDVGKLYTIANGLWGKYGGRVPKRLYWTAYILAAWSTGLRRCDLLSLRREDIPPSGRIVMVQIKSGRHVFGQLSKEAMLALADLAATHKDPLVFPHWCRVPTWRKIAQRLVRRAGLRLSIGKLRASAGTAVEILHPGLGPQFLGNTPAIFYAHYFDRRQATDMPQPPNLSTG
jgi:integrase